MDIDTSKWSGEGSFTQVMIDALKEIPGVAYIRVEDAPASRSEADYNFISNEIYLGFAIEERREPVRRFGLLRSTRVVHAKLMTVAELEQTLTAAPAIGAPDYSDEAMLQYLRTERIIPPYQTRGYKLVELVRLYEIDGVNEVPSPSRH
jgi:hypothetical protein